MLTLCRRKTADPRFTLTARASDALAPGPRLETLRLEYEGRIPEKTAARNALVYPGLLLARHPDPGIGDLHVPLAGVVSEAGPLGVTIAVGAPAPKTAKKSAPEEEPAAEPVIPETAPVDLSALSGAELAAALKELGIDTGSLVHECATLVINGLNPEPGIAWAEPMLRFHLDVLAAGVAVLRRLPAGNGAIVLAVGEGNRPELNTVEVRQLPAVYPGSLDPLVVSSVTGRENPDAVAVLGLHALWGLGRVAKTGLPLTETVLTVNGVNMIVPAGAPVRTLLHSAGLEAGDGDWVVSGGPMRGTALPDIRAGISKKTYGLCVVRGDEVPPLEGDAACIGCGECVQICPARLQPDMLSRFSEFGKDDKCRDLHIEACMDCGLCTYVCPARRPVLQYLRLARLRLAGRDTAR